jgi:hypothetical protein
VVARRDLTGFQHLHPTREPDGTWSVPLQLPDAGPYKVFADFTPQDRDTSVVLAADLTVPGDYAPAAAPPPPASPPWTATRSSSTASWWPAPAAS